MALFIIVGLLALTFVIYQEITNKETKIVKCYDRFQNEIIGQECLHKGYDYPDWFLAVIPLFFFSCILIAFYMALKSAEMI